MPIEDKVETYSVQSSQELDLSAGETPGEGDADPQSLEAILQLAREQGAT